MFLGSTLQQVRRVIVRPHSSRFASGDGSYNGAAAGSNTARGNSQEWRWEVDPASDRVVLEEKDDAFFADVGKTKDHAFVVINVHSKTTSEVYLIRAMSPGSSDFVDSPGVGGALALEKGGNVRQTPEVEQNGSRQRRNGPTLLRRRRSGVEYYVDHCDGTFYVVTNLSEGRSEEGIEPHVIEGNFGAKEYRLIRVRWPGVDSSLEGISSAPWEPVCDGADEGLRAPADDLAENSYVAPAVRPDNWPGKDGDHRESGSMRKGVYAVEIEGDSSASGARGLIQEMDLFKGKCLLYESCPHTGGPRLRIVSTDNPASPSVVVFPPPPGGCDDRDVGGNDGERTPGAAGASTLRPGVNQWVEARTARFSLSSPVAPEDIYDIDLESGRLELLKRTEVPGTPRFDGRYYR